MHAGLDRGQNLDLQRDALAAAGCTRVYQDACIGVVQNRPGWNQVMEVAREGDVVVVWKLDRIGRNLRHVIDLVEEPSGISAFVF